MKKIIVSIMLISSIGWALLGGAGLYGLQDQFAIPADSVMDFSLDDDGTIYGDLIRTEMKQPIGLGGFAYVDILPIDLEIFGEIAFSSYEYQFRTFDAALDLGNGRDLVAYQTKLDACEAALNVYNQKLADLDELLNQFQAVNKQLLDFNAEMLAGVKAIYGRDSNEYEKAGGTRLSERKKPQSKTIV